ncbi:MAG: phospholipase D family protein [Verrucomicrobia bacterium]|nr:phospholipase D family protein [Verrucomicrobiota bacterium]MCH8510780.1 phospholipase D family protein [Kiritimatiellia bacterium]
MLEPGVRGELVEALRPPSGYEVDYAVGTTFSLDLMAMLLVPLSFALLEVEDHEEMVSDPLLLLEALRRHADRVDLFCQGGAIHLPKGDASFFHFLEGGVHEVLPPKEGGLFHPKVWALRFRPLDVHEPVRYRLLVMSRNLTFDQSWDTLLRLESDPEKKASVAKNRPLCDFLRALPDMMPQPQPKTRERVLAMAGELRGVHFELPPEFEEFDFHPLGIRGYDTLPLPQPKRHRLILSPFLDQSGLRELIPNPGTGVLVSREEALRSLPPDLFSHFQSVWILHPDALGDSADEAQEASLLRGLHAKCFVVNDGWNSQLFTGSANATGAGLHQNVEFMVRLAGKESRCGMTTMMSSKQGTTSFMDLLTPFTPGSEAEPVDPEAQLDWVRTRVFKAFAAAGGALRIVENEETSGFDVQLRFQELPAHREFEIDAVRCWPVTLPESGARTLPSDLTPIAFTNCTLEALSCFMALDVKTRVGEGTTQVRFVLKLPVEGMPADREDRLLRRLLRNRNEVTRFLLYLMAEEGEPPIPMDSTDPAGGGAGTHNLSWINAEALLEPLLRCLSERPHVLDRVGVLLEQLRASEEGAALLPEGFVDLWDQVTPMLREVRR